ncbi:hypothetical protein ACA910_013041 [Epithemia clementina (nom. ined.)]
MGPTNNRRNPGDGDSGGRGRGRRRRQTTATSSSSRPCVPSSSSGATKRDDANDKDEDEAADNDSTTAASARAMIPTVEGHLPLYLADAFGELYEEDGLIVLGKGLGCLLLLATFVRFYADTTEDGYMALLQEEQEQAEENSNNKNNTSKDSQQQPKTRANPPLVLVLSLQEQERQSLIQILQSWGTPLSMMPTMITNEAGQAKDRQALYARGGVFCITSRILITDLLTKVVTANDIAGLLVYRADQVTDESTEAFILRIFHSQRQPQCSGFVKAFSESADQLQSGFAKVDKVLKALRVRRLYLYPRFHESIRQELEQEGGEAEEAEQQQQSPAVVVTELHQPLSPLQKEIQHCIAAAVQTCIRELKQATGSKLEWSHADLAMENCVTAQFDRTISKQLEHEWHQLSPTVKQYVQDLRTLRTLFQSLLQYDCVSFWKLLQNIQTVMAASSSASSLSSRHASMWLLTPAAVQMFRKAKERVYRIELSSNQDGGGDDNYPREQQAKNARSTHAKLVAVLEENPKWKLLRKLLEEIQTEYQQKQKREQTNTLWPCSSSSCVVLVLVKDNRTMDTLQSYLTGGKKQTLAYTWLRYLEQTNDRSRAILTTTTTTASTSADPSTNVNSGMSALSEERRLLLEEEGRVRRILFGRNNNSTSSHNKKPTPPSLAQPQQQQQKQQQQSKQTKRKLNEVPAYLKKRRRVATEKGRGNLARYSKDDLERQAVLDDAMEEVEHGLEEKHNDDKNQNHQDHPFDHNDSCSSDDEDFDSSSDDNDNLNNNKKPQSRQAIAERLERLKQRDDEMEQAMFRVTNDPSELRIVMKSLAGVEAGSQNSLLLLQDIRPTHVVFYDVDVAFIRSVEIYASLRQKASSSSKRKTKQDPLQTYFLVFEQSAEEKNFKKILEREQNAFERLIHHKMVMPPPMLHDTTQSQEMQQAAGSATSTYMDGTLPLAFDSRKGLGNSSKKKAIRRDIAVDVREFRAALPSILHQGGMRLAPVTLTVGDFVLSNVHCVERKSIGDLFGSFASGRLYTQAEAMCKHYKVPCLLIEFDPNKSFSLQNPNELGLDIKQDSACTKMALLCMHFPALRLLWSKNPHETLKIFQDLKKNHEEVDVDKAIEVGRNESLEAMFQGPNTTTGRSKNSTNAGSNVDEEEEEEDEVNEAARDMLLRLPGVTVQAARRIMEQVDCLKDLAEMSREKLRKIAGPVAGQKIFTFFRQQPLQP